MSNEGWVRRPSQLVGACAQARWKTLQWFGCSSHLSAETRAAAPRPPRQHWWLRARSPTTRAMGVASPAGKPLTAGACLCTPFAHAIHTLTGVLGSCSQERGIGSCWSFVDKGMGWRVRGCLLWLESQWIAACLAVQLLVRRESGSRDLDLGLHHGRGCQPCCGGGRCLRRSRAPGAR